MLKKTITFDDLDGNPVTEDFYFHLSKAEIARMELSAEGGSLEKKLKAIIAAEDGKTIIDMFESIVLGAVGKKSADNKRFIKNQEVRDEFAQSDAYSVLFMQLISNAEESAAFIRGIVPADLSIDLPAETVSTNVFQGDVQATPTTALPYSAEDIMKMSPEEFAALQAQRTQ